AQPAVPRCLLRRCCCCSARALPPCSVAAASARRPRKSWPPDFTTAPPGATSRGDAWGGLYGPPHLLLRERERPVCHPGHVCDAHDVAQFPDIRIAVSV